MPLQPKTFGVTEPMSTDAGTPSDLELDKKLRVELEPLGVFETKEEYEHRRDVLAVMNKLASDWIRDVIFERTKSKETAEAAGGQIFTFGSFRLGVNSRAGDIDTLIVAPVQVRREDFFDSFLKILMKHPDAVEVNAVEDTFVPAIKMEFMGIEIDLLFARLAVDKIPKELDLRPPGLLKNLDDKCIRSLNGCRVTDSILNLVPNVDTFRLALRTIKLWAKNRGIYSNVLGFPGGVAWAMMTARVCQFYPNAAASTIVCKFFFIFKTWNWPNPVLLCDFEVHPSLDLEQWDPRVKERDRFDLMPIITPSYPCMNSTHNVMESTLAVMKREFERGFTVCDDIVKTKGTRVTFDKLWEKVDFFANYKMFIIITAEAASEDDLVAFAGLVQANIRWFVKLIPEGAHGIPYPKEYSVPRELDEEGKPVGPWKSAWFIGVQLLSEEKNLDLSLAAHDFISKVERKKGMITVGSKEDMLVSVVPKKPKHLPLFLFPDGKRPQHLTKRTKSLKTKKAAPAPNTTGAAASVAEKTPSAAAVDADANEGAKSGSGSTPNAATGETLTAPTAHASATEPGEVPRTSPPKRKRDADSSDDESAAHVSKRISSIPADELEDLESSVVQLPASQPLPTLGAPKLVLGGSSAKKGD
eukprot:m.32264 g.32264  ORF g.32264 m.32264 type:complete len:642 (+) comp14094_c0_seq1:97-2022(+)